MELLAKYQISKTFSFISKKGSRKKSAMACSFFKCFFLHKNGAVLCLSVLVHENTTGTYMATTSKKVCDCHKSLIGTWQFLTAVRILLNKILGKFSSF